MASTCKACGDGFDPKSRHEKLSHIGKSVVQGELLFCLECANEIFRGVISNKPARLHSAGRGCPMEPNEDDSSPWQDNAIRDMEQ
jgi:hypothetical protein